MIYHLSIGEIVLAANDVTNIQKISNRKCCHLNP